MASEKILIVDDEPNILSSLAAILEDEGFVVSSAQCGAECLGKISKSFFDLVMLDIWMEEMDGLETLGKIKELKPYLPVIMMSGHGTIESAVAATKLGAYDFIEKPLSLEKVLLVINHALEQQRLEEENRSLRQNLEKHFELVGISKAMQSLKKELDLVAPTMGRVLIYGENGTGKELVARRIHQKSLRSKRPFVEVNCAAIPEDLIESELFGHEKGAFTGAVLCKTGKFEQASQGTIFLDEIGDMSIKTQAKVLRVLQEQSFQRVGGTKLIEVDVRVIAATNQNLEEKIREGSFREDLYYRLNVIPFYLPPLRERTEDIPVLVEHFLMQFSLENGKKKKSMEPGAVEALCSFYWPGNIRELKNIIERLVIMVQSDCIGLPDLPTSIKIDNSNSLNQDSSFSSLREARNAFEKEYILQVLQQNGGNISKTAEKLHIGRNNLYIKMKALGINPESSRSEF